VGLGKGVTGNDPEWPAHQSVRNALSWPPGHPITLHVKTKRGKTKRSADAFLKWYMVFGEIAASMRPYLNTATMRRYPQFHLDDFDSLQPGVVTGFAGVTVGVTAHDPRYPRLEHQEFLNWNNPGRPEPFRIKGQQFYSAKEIGDFVTRTMTLYEQPGTPGAPPGVRNPHIYPRRLVEIAERLRHRPTQAEFRRNFYQFEGEGKDVPPELAEKTLKKFLTGQIYESWAGSVLDADDIEW
jgi:hypothetical protein